MKKPKTPKPKQPRHGNLQTKVQQAHAYAAQEILIGAGIYTDPRPGQEMLTQRLAYLTGDDDLVYGDRTERQHEQLYEWLESAMALGIAIGLLMRPEAFGIGGRS